MPLASPLTDNLQGWGTVAGAVIAAVALYFAFRAYRSQARQLADQQSINEQQSKILELQAEELRQSLVERQAERVERRRAQISDLFVSWNQGIEDDGPRRFFRIKIENTSSQPVYDLRVQWTFAGMNWEPQAVEPESYPNPTPRLAPHDQAWWTAYLPPDSAPNIVRAYIELRDSREVSWRVKDDGRIEEVLPPHNTEPTARGA